LEYQKSYTYPYSLSSNDNHDGNRIRLKREHGSNWSSIFNYNLSKQTSDNNKSPTIVFISIDDPSF